MKISPWPELYVPGMSQALPALKMKSTYGEKIFSSDPINPIRMYVCGITPYDSTHLGHAATYITFDLIHRYILATGGTVSFVENITDIDEPLLERASRDNTDWQSLALDQVQLFESDMSALHILPPKYFVPATQVMDEVAQAIETMEKNGFVYKVGQDIYFDISSYLDELPISVDEALRIFSERGGDPQRSGKRHPLDPVLWLANKNGEPGWESPYGFGRPGWHIECCVISLKYLRGPQYLGGTILDSAEKFLIDIQGGGTDLIFPHHFMSAAQAHAMTGRTFAKAYIHSGMIGLDGEKMSKSKGNLLFVSQLISDGEDPMAIRLALLLDKYSQDRMWTELKLEVAKELLQRIRLNLSKMEVAPAAPLIASLGEALSRDLDTPAAIVAIQAWCEESEASPSVDEAGQVSRALDSLLGLAL